MPADCYKSPQDLFSASLHFAGDQVVEEDPKMEEERVPHDDEGEECPLVVTVACEPDGGEEISTHVCERQHGIQSAKQDHFR